jgi:Tol biopolymer transport system component
MFRSRNRILLLASVLSLAGLIIAGCTSKEDPSEVLILSGNHSAGTLTMVTSDTSSNGYYYLNPILSPNGSRILFTADWWAIPSDPRYAGDDAFTLHRQMCLIPLREALEPATSLTEQGGELVVLREITLPIGGQDVVMNEVIDDDKGNPIWQDDNTIIFWLQTNVGNRLFRADITDPSWASIEVLYMETTDGQPSPPSRQHMEPTLSPDGNWLAFTRSGCVEPDSFETCTGLSLMVLDMNTAAIDNGYKAVAFPITNEYSRIEAPKWSPDGTKLIFAGGEDLHGGTGVGTELFTIEFDTTGSADGMNPLDNRLKRLTFTSPAEGSPISGIINTDPVYTNGGTGIYFVSNRRAPTTTLHDRNIWRMSSDGLTEPVIHYFTRDDDMNPYMMPSGTLLFSSALGFPTEMLDRIEEETYQRISLENDQNDLGLDEVQMRTLAADQRRNLEFFQGVMSWLYTFTP